jgi:hypothetical protein
MEIYSPRSKNKNLFRNNQMKSEVKKVNTPVEQEIIIPVIVPESVVSNQENLILRMHRNLVERLKIFFEMNETVG